MTGVGLSLEPVTIGGSPDTEGQLVFAHGKLVAILVRLSALHGDEAGAWFLEVGFGVLAGPTLPTFASLDEALAWMRPRLADNPRLS